MVRVWVHFGLPILTYTSVNFLRKAAPSTTDGCWKWHRAGENARQTNRNPARHTTTGILWRHRDIPAYPAGTRKQVLPREISCSLWYHFQPLGWLQRTAVRRTWVGLAGYHVKRADISSHYPSVRCCIEKNIGPSMMLWKGYSPVRRVHKLWRFQSNWTIRLRLLTRVYHVLWDSALIKIIWLGLGIKSMFSVYDWPSKVSVNTHVISYRLRPCWGILRNWVQNFCRLSHLKFGPGHNIARRLNKASQNPHYRPKVW